MSEILILIIAFCSVTIGALFLLQKYLELKKKLKKYGNIPDLDLEGERLTSANKDMKKNLDNSAKMLERLHEKHKSLARECSVYEDNLNMVDYGFYTPQYEFKNSEGYKEKLEEVRRKQKQLIVNERAIECGTEWAVGGSKSKGRTATKRFINLTLNAFNVQCDNAILTVKFNNIVKSEERMHKIRKKIDQLGKSWTCEVTGEFFNLKLEELRLAFEYAQKVQDEKEEQRQIREMMREEEKVRRDIEKAKEEADKDEKTYAKALVKARKELSKADEETKQALERQIADLELQLAEAHQKGERAMSMAQQTKRGHVYIISNIGSFGEDVLKIGLTRRLEPLDRVKELGDASVPFAFDVHAMIYSEDAPALEAELHKNFAKSRINMVNNRKEFFAVSLDEISQKCDEIGGVVHFTKYAEAKQYRETMAIKAQVQQAKDIGSADGVDELLAEVTKQAA